MGATPFERLPAPILDLNGNLAPGALAYFTVAVDTPLAVYQDAALTTPHANPVVADATGRLPYIFLPYGDYNVRIATASNAAIFTALGCSNPKPPDDGGGGGIIVTAPQIFATGYPMPLFQAAAPTGFVPMLGTTIGNAASGATARANSDTAALFAYLWSNLADAQAAVSTGRGATAEADYAANKTIVVPTMVNLVAGGVGSGLTTTLGATIGTATKTLALANLPPVTLNGNATNIPNYLTQVNPNSGQTNTGSGYGVLTGFSTSTYQDGTVSGNASVSLNGSSSPVNIIQPTRAFNWFMKL